MADFQYHELDPEQESLVSDIREKAEILDEIFDERCVPSRETSLAKTKLEEAVMWAVKSVSVNGRK